MKLAAKVLEALRASVVVVWVAAFPVARLDIALGEARRGSFGRG